MPFWLGAEGALSSTLGFPEPFVASIISGPLAGPKVLGVPPREAPRLLGAVEAVWFTLDFRVPAGCGFGKPGALRAP